jgi:AcrR family transcriptional regulator
MARGLSERAHQKVLDTAAELFAERGIDATSIDAIAADSGVSKATIYKHWADKDALCLEVLSHVHRLEEGPPELDSGDLKADIEAFLIYEPPHRAEIMKRLMPHLIAYSVRNQEFGRAWKTRVTERTRAGLKRLLQRGVERGIFPAVLDQELGVALLLGPMMYRHIFGPKIDKQWLAQGAVGSFWKAYAQPQQQNLITNKRRVSKRRKPRR